VSYNPNTGRSSGPVLKPRKPAPTKRWTVSESGGLYFDGQYVDDNRHLADMLNHHGVTLRAPKARTCR
jgi:hypothetical protein